MDVTPLVKVGQQIIQSYASGGFKVSGVQYNGAVIVTPEQTSAWGVLATFSDLSPDHFSSIDKRNVILLGTGKTMQFIPLDLKVALKAAGYNVESMDTAAACRTYNVLMAEGRMVAAALMPIS